MPEHTVPSDLDWIRAAPEEATGPGPWIEIAFGLDDHVYLRETSDPANVVTTTRRKWDAFVLGVQAGEFDHFVEGVQAPEDATAGTAREAGEAATGSQEPAGPERTSTPGAAETSGTAGAKEDRRTSG